MLLFVTHSQHHSSQRLDWIHFVTVPFDPEMIAIHGAPFVKLRVSSTLDSRPRGATPSLTLGDAPGKTQRNAAKRILSAR
jgi:hypothetical protein